MHWLESLRIPGFAADLEKIAQRMASVLPPQPASVWRQAARDYARMRSEDAWGRLRAIGFRRWTPQIVLEGEQRLRDELRERGAVLWAMRFSSSLAIQQALHRAGFPLVHLSSAIHGARSGTPFAERVVSPLFARAEKPYLAARVLIPTGGGLGYMNTLREHLAAKACISIFGEHQTARGAAPAQVLGGTQTFATGAPSLAWQENAALFTVHALRTGPFAYRVVIGDPIPVDRSMPRKEFNARAVAEFARRLEALIQRHPADWQGWASLNGVSSGGAAKPKNPA